MSRQRENLEDRQSGRKTNKCRESMIDRNLDRKVSMRYNVKVDLRKKCLTNVSHSVEVLFYVTRHLCLGLNNI